MTATTDLLRSVFCDSSESATDQALAIVTVGQFIVKALEFPELVLAALEELGKASEHVSDSGVTYWTLS